ncbi:Phosphatidate cytidylyltransferase [Candidatus Accumulibacter aalborgensis]|uniref:Phosphatidate cytidylyltransferase n=1 Tax=Candidatus Accumulibacter aalborgensis TaxID=1860102 RepID=A0A1A8XKR4_9PROT|nr:phosphatidate cytidylyltransferase [Candidatus Accumulibacter aalborgensis]SBT05271.1 Phosphatidate cytidylyltransferase [Candidatus Accumulibacter aalborgensis]
MTHDHWPALDEEAWLLVAGIASVLVIASLLGCLLKITVARRATHATIDNAISRINSWWVIAIVVGFALLCGRSGVTLLFALVSLAALREFVAAGIPNMPDVPGSYPRAIIPGTVLLIVPLQYLLVWKGSYLLFTALIPCLVWVVLPILGGLLSARIPGLQSRMHTLQAGLLICVFSISHIPALLTLQIDGHPERNGYLLIYLLLVVQASDVLQYLWGRLAGRHLITPGLSPSKTVEGTVGGIVTATVLGAGLSSLTPFTIVEGTLISLLITLLGFASGLAMSAVKRRRGIKDWGSLIPGHGGILDRIDSLFLPAPAFYYLLRYGWAN